MTKLFLLALSALLLCQCNSTRVVGHVPNPPVTRLAIIRNNDLHMEELEPEILRQVRAMGIDARLVNTPPRGNEYHMTYVANWYWDFAMYLRYFQATLHRGPTRVRGVEYSTSGLDMNKFGHTANKVRPLLRQLLISTYPTP